MEAEECGDEYAVDGESESGGAAKDGREAARPAKPATRFCTKAQMAVMTERGVPMHLSSQAMALSMPVGMGGM